ncbi:hypothetical protein BCR36DRAFT_413136 [Piromyces finnis]|uniref:RING-CH-type domain-containing protein n=1 Tax=Piromyces finnis TaxID=1754191 RepID=A0A1Y1V6G8_9FUNG|nr:hypothetical protein BCR36DRAFT_413136 [Piromyces finnis]|eukprot:ORX48361.1 hypothetical protein BCR36DRAFT_413136 [Piromyces finnis]
MDTEKYTCFICWESISLSDKKERNEVISCCRCTHNDYKYAHITCLKYWVNSSNGNNKKCNICCSPYVIQKARIPFSTMLKSYWLIMYFYILLVIASFILSVITWAKFMIPTAVYIITPIFNKETHQYENEKDTSVVYVESDIYQKVLVIIQTIVLVILCFFVGKLILSFIGKRTNNNKLIGMNPDNQIISVELKKEVLKEEKQPIIYNYIDSLDINII